MKNITEEPQINDYVICHISTDDFTGLRKELDYINNTIGQIYKILEAETLNIPNRFRFYIKYNTEIPEDIKYWFGYNKEEKRYFRSVIGENILYFAPTLEELKIKISATKYNL